MSAIRLPIGILVAGAILYAMLIVPFADYMKHKTVEEKLGYIPNLAVVRLLSAEQKELAGAVLLMKVFMYFGGVAGKQAENIVTQPLDYREMERVIRIALHLDPYNTDGYYFAQSILVWDMKQYQAANNLLEYGMKYRTWDWFLPFSAGFNYAYFLKDYQNAAAMYIRTGEITGDPLYARLAGKYLQQSGQTAAAIAYLEMMARQSRDQTVINVFRIRIKALQEVELIEQARDRFSTDRQRLPSGVDELVAQGYLAKKPVDPYGGSFYLQPDGTVTSTSKFAFKPSGFRSKLHPGVSNE